MMSRHQYLVWRKTHEKLVSCLDTTKASMNDEISPTCLQDIIEIVVSPLIRATILPIKLYAFPNLCINGDVKPQFKNGFKIDMKVTA